MTFAISLNLNTTTFRPLPSQTFEQTKALSCNTNKKCKLPNHHTLQKAAKEFLNHSESRLHTLDKIKSEIRSALQTYDLANEEVFSKIGI